jgi:hypothetical protein
MALKKLGVNKMRLKMKLILIIVFIIVIFNVACTPQWSFLIRSSGKEFLINDKTLKEYQYLMNEDSKCNGISLEIIFYQLGFYTIESIELGNSNQNQTFSWGDIANEACISDKGKLIIRDKEFHLEEITVVPSQFNDLQISLLDVFPTALAALDIDFDRGNYRNPLTNIKTNHVILVFLDGFNNEHYLSAIEKGLMEKISKSDMYKPALTVYPPRTTVASGAVLTGKAPINNGVFKSGIRQTTEKTIFDFVVENSLSVISVGGESLPFNLSNSKVFLSGDRDENGSTDDNVFSNVTSVIENGIPNLLYIHFHGIDDMGHTFGPDSAEVWEKIEEIDGYLNEIIQLLPEDCMVVTFADHGMHEIVGGSDRGNHGNLIDEDMVVFINILIT